MSRDQTNQTSESGSTDCSNVDLADEVRELKLLCENHIEIAKTLKNPVLLTLSATVASRLEAIETALQIDNLDTKIGIAATNCMKMVNGFLKNCDYGNIQPYVDGTHPFRTEIEAAFLADR